MDSDESLFEAYRRKGDRDALDRLFRRPIDGVYRTTQRILRNEADARDATQSAFLNVLRHSEKQGGRSYPAYNLRLFWIDRIHLLRTFTVAEGAAADLESRTNSD